jgi:hypothetical protein
MSTRSKFIIAGAIVMLGFASPAFAQSFNRSDGTGNELPSYYDGQGGLHGGIAAVQQNQTTGLYAFASVRHGRRHHRL